MDFLILGNPALDMTRVIVLNTDTEVRKELETFILEYYFDNLKSKMAQNGKSLPESWTLEMVGAVHSMIMSMSKSQKFLCRSVHVSKAGMA